MKSCQNQIEEKIPQPSPLVVEAGLRPPISKNKPLAATDFSEADRKRFWAKVKKGTPSECWEWLSCKNEKGYGRFCLSKINHRAHRLSYFLAFGSMPILCICHRCDNPSCVNPSHFFLGTIADNNKDCRRKGRSANTKKTHCSNGHEFAQQNTRKTKQGYRVCRECRRAIARSYKLLKRKKQ